MKDKHENAEIYDVESNLHEVCLEFCFKCYKQWKKKTIHLHLHLD